MGRLQADSRVGYSRTISLPLPALPPIVSASQPRGLLVDSRYQKKISELARDLPAPLTVEDTAHTYSLLKDHMLSAMREVNEQKQPQKTVVTDVTDSAQQSTKRSSRGTKLWHQTVFTMKINTPALGGWFAQHPTFGKCPEASSQAHRPLQKP